MNNEDTPADQPAPLTPHEQDFLCQGNGATLGHSLPLILNYSGLHHKRPVWARHLPLLIT